MMVTPPRTYIENGEGNMPAIRHFQKPSDQAIDYRGATDNA